MFDRFLFFVPVVLVTVTHITRSATYPLVLAMSLDALYSYLTLWNPNHTLIWILKKCFMPKQTKVTTCLSVHDWINWTTQHSYCLILFIFGGPRHLSSFKQCSGIVFFLFIQSWNQMNISGFVLSPRKHFKCLKSWVWISSPKPQLKPPPFNFCVCLKLKRTRARRHNRRRPAMTRRGRRVRYCTNLRLA